ncbi:MAG: Rab family GTPase [Promethearchaeota archaeon]
MRDDNVFKYKICIVGEYAAGKTSLTKRFVDNEFAQDYRPTIGTNIFIKRLNINEDRCTVYIWDIAAQERWHNLRKSYYKGAQGIIVVGDLTRKRTFIQLEKFWMGDIKNHSDPDVVKIFIANKKDLPSEVSDEFLEEFRRKHKIDRIIKTSAKTGENVELAFIVLLNKLIKRAKEKMANISELV